MTEAKNSFNEHNFRIQRGIAQSFSSGGVYKAFLQKRELANKSLFQWNVQNISPKKQLMTIWRILPNLRGCPLSLDVPLDPHKPPFQNGESWQL